MERGSTIFLKTAVFLMGAWVLVLGLGILPKLAAGLVAADSSLAGLKYPVLIGINLTALPFFAALYQALKLLGYIDQNEAFSELSVAALRRIKHCAAVICLMYGAGSAALALSLAGAYAYIWAIGLVIVFASLIIGVFAALLQKLLKDAIEIKSENDLTI